VTVPTLRLGLLVVVLAVLVVPGTASAALSVSAQSTTVAEAGSPRNGVIDGGDTVDVTVQLHNTEATALTGIEATLSSSAIGITPADADYPDLDGFATAAGDTPFRIELPAADCGEIIPLTLTVTSGGETATIPIAVTTGLTPSSSVAWDQPSTIAIPSPLPTMHAPFLAGSPTSGQVTSSISVGPQTPSTVRVKDVVRVRLGQLTMPDVGHVVITLIAPDGASVVLIDHRGAGSQQLSGTVFEAGGAPLSSGSPPYTGTFRPEGNLASLVGHRHDGAWRLRIEVDDRAELGTMQGWGLDLKAASCAAQSFAALTVTPSHIEPGDTATLDASGSLDAGGAPLSYVFDIDGDGDFEPGSSADIDNGTDPTLDHMYATNGLRHVGVQVSAGGNVIGTATADLSVSMPPTATLVTTPGLTPDSGQEVTFDGTTSSDTESPTLGYEWSVDGGPYAAGTDTFKRTFPKKATHVVRLRVTDGDGATDVAAVTVDVQNRDPSASFVLSAPPAAADRITTFDASASADPDGTIANYAWDLDGNGSYETDRGTSPTASTTFTSTGTKTVGLRITDDDGAVVTFTDPSVAVTRAPVLGVLSALPAQPRPGANVTFTLASASDPDGGPVTYDWSFGDGATVSSGTASEAHTFATEATFDVTVTVTDDEGAQTTAALAFLVSGMPPVAALTVTPNPVATGAVVHLDASASTDPDSTIARYRFDLDGNGSFETDSVLTPTATASYPNPGVVTVRVRVTDDDGHNTAAAVNLTVQSPATQPGGGSAGTGGGSASPSDDGPAPGGAGGGDTGAPDGGDGGTSVERFSAALAGPSIQTLKAVLKGGVSVACETSSAARCTLRVELSATDARRLGLSRSRTKAFVVARATVKTDGTKAHKVALKVARRIAGKLRRAGRVTVTVAGQAVDAAGHKVSVKRAVLVRNR
jgi:subtilisin-like proprotein convertase family protein